MRKLCVIGTDEILEIHFGCGRGFFPFAKRGFSGLQLVTLPNLLYSFLFSVFLFY